MRSLSLFLALLCCVISGASPLAAAEPVQVLVTGVEGVILQNVQAAVTVPPGVVEGGELNLPWFERFERQVPEKVQAALEPFGFYNAQVTTSRETVADGSRLLRVRVVPGPPVMVTEAAVTLRGPGAQEKPLRDLAGAFPLRKGSVLRQDIYEKAKGELKSRAQELGYLDAEYSVGQILLSRAEGTARIELALETGSRYFFGEVSFTGAEIYPESFLRRYLAFRTGDHFAPSKLGVTQLNLINSDRFKDVHVTSEKEKVRDFVVPVLIGLEPSLPKRLRFGVGYGTDTGARVTINYRDLNVFGRGHEFNSELNIAERLQGFAAGYRIPGSVVDTFTGLQFKLQQEDTTTFVSKVISAEVNRTHGFGRNMIGTVYVRVQNEESTVGDTTANANFVLPGIRFTQHKYDNTIRPEKGFRYGLEVRGTDRFPGSDVGLLQVLGNGKLIVPLPWRLSLLPRFQGAATFSRDTVTSLPASLRFFAGGDNSVRGYSYQSLGPKDDTGTVVGGRYLLVGSLELERAIGKSWAVATFYDVGNAFNILQDIVFAQGAGLGVRYYTPVGAIRFDVARQIGVEDPGFHIHFTLGFEL